VIRSVRESTSHTFAFAFRAYRFQYHVGCIKVRLNSACNARHCAKLSSLCRPVPFRIASELPMPVTDRHDSLTHAWRMRVPRITFRPPTQMHGIGGITLAVCGAADGELLGLAHAQLGLRNNG